MSSIEGRFLKSYMSSLVWPSLLKQDQFGESNSPLSSTVAAPCLLANFYIYTTKKSSYPSVFFPAFLQTAIIDKSVPALFQNAGIGNPIMAAQNQRFIKRCNRRPIAAFFKNAGIGSPKTLG